MRIAGNSEDWEAYYRFIEKGDYEGLLCYYKKQAATDPDDLHIQYYLGEAYILNGKCDEAIEFLAKLHKGNPQDQDFQHLILDALFALGKNETDFDWVMKPVILRLSRDMLDSCYESLRPKRKPYSIGELYTGFFAEGYVAFTEDELLHAILEDNRFIVENTQFHAEIRVARKSGIKKKIP
jgi:tetratricopeptide (TPR) repeat protein